LFITAPLPFYNKIVRKHEPLVRQFQYILRISLFILLLFPGVIIHAQDAALSGGRTGSMADGELVLRAYKKCFPDKIGEISYIENDWTVIAGSEIFFWAGGRLLPKAEKDEFDSWSPHIFYGIPAKPASPDTYPPQFIETLRSRGSSEARMEQPDSHRSFHGIIYGGLERKDIEANLERIDFLGAKVNIHRNIAAALRRIDAEIRKNHGGENFIGSIASIEGYSWRPIAGTQRMSYHSWGLAIDIQPKRLGGKAIYWMWERGRNKDWMLVPLENRWNPPDMVINAFEKEGFVWGGKWPFYDNMHFEYRPELHEFSRLMTAKTTVQPAGSGAELHHIYPDNIRNKK